jgi:hypothetical protein
MKDEVDGLDPADYKDHTIYESNEFLRRKIAKPQLTAARIMCATHGKKVFFGQPSTLTLIEDICARSSLQ